MADTLRIVAVRPDGDGEQLGLITFADDALTGDTAIASDQIDMLRRRTRMSDPDIFGHLTRDGYSNGQLMVRPA